MLQPDMCTDTELVFLQPTGQHNTIHTGVRFERWFNRWGVAPLAGGSRKFARKLKMLNFFGLGSLVSSLGLGLSPFYGMLSLPMGTPVSLAKILPLEPTVFCASLCISFSMSAMLYYFQYSKPIVQAIWFEPSTRTVCVELVNFFKIFNLENRAYTTGDYPTVIKIPQKFCSAEFKHSVKARSIEFDLAMVSLQLVKYKMLNSHVVGICFYFFTI